MKKKNKNDPKISKTFEDYNGIAVAEYPREFVNFLGGKEQLSKINIFGHRIIFVMLEMLKSVQVHKISKAEAKEIISNDLTIKNGRIVSLAEIKEEAIEERRILESGKKMAIIEEEYFADQFNMLQFIIPTKALNNNGAIKVEDNSVFHNQLKVFKTLGNHEVKSKVSGEILMSNFVETTIYNVGESYIRFYISLPTAKILLNNIEGYDQVYRNLVFNSTSPMPLNVFLYLKSKFGKMAGGNIKIKKFVSDLNLPDYYKNKSKLIKFLNSIRENLNKNSLKSFGFEILEDDSIDFALYDTVNSIGVEFTSNDTYQASNALKYIKKNRKLTDHHLIYIKGKFEDHGYLKISQITKSRLKADVIGDDYLKWFVAECNRLGL